MKLNTPVTQREYLIAPDRTLMSTTDVDSRITYANDAFIEASGYDRGELMSQPHNVVRHPDMPAQAFADMWQTIQGGEAWTALVKNRRKNGDFYWVRANATPVRRNGQLVGYMSVRTTPTRDEVARVEPLYAAFREDRARGLRFHKGLVLRRGPLAWTSALQWLPVRWRIRGALLAGAGAVAAAAAGAGLAGAPLASFAGAVAAISALLCAWLEAQVSAPLAQVLAQAQAVASGQPGNNIHLNRVDEMGLLMRAINQSGLNLRALVDDVGGQVSGLYGASGEIAAGNQHLSSRTEQTASSLQQTAASMEQLTASVKANADTARQATVLAASATQAATQGGDAMGQVTGTMDQIASASDRIADIVGVIDGIAFQTNILALNAAVEAARAGEQGRGFAVVAGEVRTLAKRSSDAVREIKQLIDDSVAKVANGSRIANDAGGAMQEIVAQVQSVSQLIGQISHATTEQSTGITQVNAAVGQLDQMTQQNAALVEQSAAAAESLQEQARHLSDSVQVFRAGR
jgi:aerotaxis receptor